MSCNSYLSNSNLFNFKLNFCNFSVDSLQYITIRLFIYSKYSFILKLMLSQKILGSFFLADIQVACNVVIMLILSNAYQ